MQSARRRGGIIQTSTLRCCLRVNYINSTRIKVAQVFGKQSGKQIRSMPNCISTSQVMPPSRLRGRVAKRMSPVYIVPPEGSQNGNFSPLYFGTSATALDFECCQGNQVCFLSLLSQRPFQAGSSLACNGVIKRIVRKCYRVQTSALWVLWLFRRSLLSKGFGVHERKRREPARGSGSDQEARQNQATLQEAGL